MITSLHHDSSVFLRVKNDKNFIESKRNNWFLIGKGRDLTILFSTLFKLVLYFIILYLYF